MAASNSIAADAIRNSRLVASFNLQDLYKAAYANSLEMPTRQMQTAAMCNGAGSGLTVFVQMGVFSLAFWYGGRLVFNGEMTFESLLIVFVSIWMAAFSMATAQMVFPDAAHASAAMDKVFGIVNRKSKVVLTPPKIFLLFAPHPLSPISYSQRQFFASQYNMYIQLDNMGLSSTNHSHHIFAMILTQALWQIVACQDVKACKSGILSNGSGILVEFSDVTFSYPQRPSMQVLQGFSLTVEAGSVVGVCGGSGAGKSTLIGLLERFYDPVAGSIAINGIPLHKIPIDKLRKMIGVVSQEPVLFSGTVKENIIMGR